MTPAFPIAIVLLACLLVLALGIRNPEQRPTTVSEEQRRRRLETQMRVQDERYFGEWYAQ